MNRNATRARGTGHGFRDLVDRALLAAIAAVLFPHPHGWLRRLSRYRRDVGRAGVQRTDLQRTGPPRNEAAVPPRPRLELVPPPPEHAGAPRTSRATPPRPRLHVVPKPGTSPERPPVNAPTARR
ncbi:hypothetical protein GCM10022214_64190 [Actinomadura miaoliensis]|uniref:Uncharacterized protein n=1 Tax=Actinomadura miaoliensis TaxID=430685 RepID=A0ABP7WPQ8_9ACTN